MGFAEMHDGWRGVEDAAKAVAAEIADDGKPLPFGVCLDCVTDIAEGRAGFDDFNAFHHGIIGDFGEAFCFDRDFITDIIHARCVAVPAIKDDGNVDIDDVTIEQFFVAGNTVANHMVDGSADGFGEAFITERGGDCSVFFGHFTAKVIEVFRRYADLHVFSDHVENFGGELSSLPHAFEIRFGVDLDAVSVIFCLSHNRDIHGKSEK